MAGENLPIIPQSPQTPREKLQRQAEIIAAKRPPESIPTAKLNAAGAPQPQGEPQK